MNPTRLGVVVALSVLLLLSATARAQLTTDTTSTTGAWPPDARWFELTTRIENTGTKPIRGFIEFNPRDDGGVGGSSAESVFRTPFAVSGGAVTTVRTPLWRNLRWTSEIPMVIEDEAGNPLAPLRQVSFRTTPTRAPILLDACHPSKVAAMLSEADLSAFSPTRKPFATGYGSKASSVLTTFSAQVDGATGDVILPASPAGYGGVTLVLLHSKQLSRLREDVLGALSDYVLSGGTLAVTVDRPEDLRSGPLVRMTGGQIAATKFPDASLRLPAFAVNKRGRLGSRRLATKSGHLIPKRVRPSTKLLESLSGYTGGNLHPTIFGSVASYGLGEVLVLPVDPTIAPASEDPWVAARLLQVMLQAWERQSTSVRMLSQSEANKTHPRNLYELLDPARKTGWAIFLVTILLLAYSILAGPVLFGIARKKHKPLRAIWQLPLLSVSMFVVVVLIGLVSKGCSAKSSRLSLCEVGAGMSRGGITRFRSFVTPSSIQLAVPGSSPTAVLDLLPTSGGSRDNIPTVEVTRDGVVLRDITTAPWRVQLVREEDHIDLASGVSISKNTQGQIEVVNRTGKTLRAAMLFLPTPPGSSIAPVFFARIKDGEHKRVIDGKVLSKSATASTITGYKFISALNLWEEQLDEQSDGLTEAWRALGSTMSRDAVWVPHDVPTLFAQVEGGEGQSTDAGMKLQRDRLLLRVVGYGGQL